jgi:hypothetical protein
MRVHGPMTPKPGLELDVFFLISDGQIYYYYTYR